MCSISVLRETVLYYMILVLDLQCSEMVYESSFLAAEKCVGRTFSQSILSRASGGNTFGRCGASDIVTDGWEASDYLT